MYNIMGMYFVIVCLEFVNDLLQVLNVGYSLVN